MQLFSDRINEDTFQLEIPEYYQPVLPEYFKQRVNSGYAVVNGRIVSDEEYQELTGQMVERNDFVPSPLYVGEPFNMCISSCSTATIIDMDTNLVPFRFLELEDIPKVIEIIQGYNSEMSPFISRSVELQKYVDRAKTTLGKLQETYAEMKHDFNVRHNIKENKQVSLLDLLSFMK